MTENTSPLSPGKALTCLFYLALFADAEMATYFIDEWVGMLLHFTILIMLLFNGATVGEPSWRQFFLALGLVPLIRITSLAVPVEEISEIYWYIIIAIPIFTGSIMVMRSLEFDFADVGFNGRLWFLQLLVGIGGIGLGAIDYFILEPDSLISSLTFQEVLIPAIILIVCTGFLEELVFRGIMQRSMQTIWKWGWVYVAFVYAVLQIGFESAPHVLFTLGVMLYFGWIVKKTGSIVGVSLAHGFLNVGLFLIFPHIL